MPNGAAVRRAADHPEDPQQEGKNMISPTVAADQKTQDMHGEASVPQHLEARTVKRSGTELMSVSGKEIFLRAIPTLAFVSLALLVLSVRPGVFWGTTLLVVLVPLMVLSILALIPKPRSR
jgi:hypothetical protein